MEKQDSSFYSSFRSYQIEFLLLAHETAFVQPFFGPAERGAILDLLRDQLPDLAKELHSSNEIRPYSLTPLSSNNHFLIPIKSFEVKIFSGNMYSFKMNIISNFVYEKLVDVLLKTDDLKFNLYNVNFSIISLQLSSKPLLNIFSPQTIADDQVPSPNAWNIFFNSPTQFKSKHDLIIPFPIPSYVFNSLFRTWKAFFPIPNFIKQDIWFDYLDQKLYCRRHKIQTVQLRFGKSATEIGFIGSCLIVSKDHNNPINSFLTSLLELGETMNVGRKSTLGFGVMKYEVKIPKDK